ncbi:hypothetical protein SAMN04489761_4273 [Tenacibaculum sp. MAR_2009_124]|uniref:hypothetical protein n=1 Tax=Tenacibaculum sp. MAR_2009_124 TaxID=1250059 RepID=UPI0008985B44|nr:hypothetical protein [Tenacibaculum sp. MAR_2009_124]SED10020.1 hypothetical protein SAMN04489761_4273 [Tenacibaculum sp. MAR_2009_124]
MYAEYFSRIVKLRGVPNLNKNQFIRYQKIVAIEYYLKQLKNENNNPKDADYTKMFEVENQLQKFTGNKPPAQLLEEMLKLSLE